MKKSIKEAVTIIILMVAVSSFGFGQEYIKMERSRILHLTNESMKTEVKISVSGEFNYLKINVSGQFRQGDILIEIFDPSGEFIRDLSIKSRSKYSKGINTTIKESVNGEIEKAYRNPTEGDWMIRVTPKESTGKIRINSILIFNPKVDLLELNEIEKDTNSNIR